MGTLKNREDGLKDICTLSSEQDQSHNSPKAEASQSPSTDTGTNRLWYVPPVEYHSALKREDIRTHDTAKLIAKIRKRRCI